MERSEKKAQPLIWRVAISPEADRHFSNLPDKRIQKTLDRHINGLGLEPEKQGKPLKGDLTGLTSKHVGRYRIIYHLDYDNHTVSVEGIGIRKQGDRKDIYKLMKKMFRQG